MGKSTRCKKCGRLLHTIDDVIPYGDHGWKFYCCGEPYYKCNSNTCSYTSRQKDNKVVLFFYQKSKHLTNHIERYHINEKNNDITVEDDEIPIILHDTMHTNISSTSYQQSSSLGKYYTENCSIEDNSFTYAQQRDAIKRIITTACNQSRGVMTVSKEIADSSYMIFFAIAQIAFIANEIVLKYLSIILSVLIPLWRVTHMCSLEIPTTPDSIKNVISSTNSLSIRTLIPMPSIEQISDHCYSSLSSLLAYTTMTSDESIQSTKPRYTAWMQSSSCTAFANQVETLSQGSTKPAIAVFMIFWSDGFDPNNSMKRNRHTVWILTVTFFFYDLTQKKLYLVESCLVAMGPGKGAAESKEDHTCVFEKLRYDLEATTNSFDGTPVAFSFASRYHKGQLCDFYLCREIHFARASLTVHSNVHIMDNPERRANFGLLAGNSQQHPYFALSCNFQKLKAPFEACVKCNKAIAKYCQNEGWIEKEPPLPRCKNCHGFSIDHLLKHGEYKEPLYVPPNDVNKSLLPGYQLFTNPGKLSNNLLIDSFITARELFLSGKMSKTAVEGYLGILCFSPKTIRDLISQCRLYQLSLDVDSGGDEITEDDILEVTMAKETAPNKIIEKPTPPPLLYICNLDCAMETVMHLGMNVSKHCEHASFNWAKQIPGFSCAELIEGAQQYLRAIDSLKIASFPVMQFKTDSMGGYVAENHRAYMQLAPWTFRWINQYQDERERNWIQELNIKDLQSWTKRDMHGYLSLRGVAFNHRSLKPELMNMVKASQDLPELQKFEPFSGSDMRQMMVVLNSFLSALFATDITGRPARNRLSSIARLYLCFSSRLDKFLLKKNPSWLTTFSLLGMLRAADIFELAPYPICFYEGDSMGEGIVKEIRPILLSGLRRGWTMAGQATLYRSKTLQYMQDMLLSPTALNLIRARKKPVRPDTKIYRFAADVEYAMEKKNAFAFSLFNNHITQQNVIAVVVSFQKQLYIRVLHVAHGESFQDPHGFAYFTTSIHPNMEYRVLDPVLLRSKTLTYVASGVALPSLKYNAYAFLLGNGQKKVPGNSHIFSPTTINKTYAMETNSVTTTSVLL